MKIDPRAKYRLRVTQPGKDGDVEKSTGLEQVMCNLCGGWGVDGRDVEGPYEDGALYRCKDQPSCRKGKERLEQIQAWKGSGEEREGRRVGMAGKHLVVEQLEPIGTAIDRERVQAIEYQVRCLECDRRASFFVNKILVGKATPEYLAAFEVKTIDMIKRVRQLGCPHCPEAAGEA